MLNPRQQVADRNPLSLVALSDRFSLALVMPVSTLFSPLLEFIVLLPVFFFGSSNSQNLSAELQGCQSAGSTKQDELHKLWVQPRTLPTILSRGRERSGVEWK